MNALYTIRDATIDDSPALNVLRTECLIERHVDVHYTWSTTRAHIEKNLGQTLFAKLVEIDGEPVGLAFVEVYDSLPSAQNLRGRVAQIRGVYIKPEHRHKQLGPRLVMDCVLKARELKTSYVEVHVQEELAQVFKAVGFTEKSGGLRLYFK